MDLTSALRAKSLDLGFDYVGIAPVGPSPDYARYQRWIETGYLGEMGYLSRHMPLKADPRQLLAEAQSVIMVGLSYAWHIPAHLRADPARGQIASYALADDYHALMRKALIELDGWLKSQTGRSSQGRVCVDSAPFLERSWGQQTGLGFVGKNTCLIRPGLGSWFFLGCLLVPEKLAYDNPPKPSHGSRSLQIDYDTELKTDSGLWWQFSNGNAGTCGSCRRCIDICPTGSLRSAYELDARLCISYLTIELRGDIPQYLRSKMGNWVFGCDLCQDVCPWNRSAENTRNPALRPHPQRLAPYLLDLLALDREQFQESFRGSAVKRSKWEGFMRNTCIAAGNWGHASAAELLADHVLNSPHIVATHAAWALGQLQDGVGRPLLETSLPLISQATTRQAVLDAYLNVRT